MVDNGSTDDTAKFLNSIKAPNGVQFRAVSEKMPGLGNARNAGWRAARADLIAFTDDDCYVTSNYIANLVKVFDDKTIGFVGGRVLLFDYRDLPVTIQTSDKQSRFTPYIFVAPGVIHGANMAFRRSALETINGFGNSMGAGARHCCEDVDAVASAVWAGIEGIYSPEVTVYHHHGRQGLRQKRAIMANYCRGTGAYYAKFVLRPDSRRTYLRILRIKVREGYADNGFIAQSKLIFWQAVGAARYCVPYFLRKPG